ncbi:peptidoglycan-binding protein [Candidatus Kaiserbacteria bacterium]|nr:peptidoglycan-binding protein [Candidatus Kaiserbacteria bacterium]
MKTNTSFKRISLEITVGIVVALAMMFGFPAPSHADTLYRQLDIGATGSDVTALQTYLSMDATIYPEGLVTSYFGSLTSAAVSRFQTRNELPPVGRVGPLTLAALNAKMSGGVTSGDVNAPIIFGVNINQATSSATVIWGTNELARGTVYYGTSPLVITELGNGVIVSGTAGADDVNFRTSHNVLVKGLQPNTTYFYLLHAMDPSGNVNITWPSTFRTTQ